ncbi:MAG TPA: ABC transporter ATP-binding protein [Verrucomicrobiae bacterium]|nr:ABC transporter ATP-binding protein [Verrucomicrobiae bacterium]
MKEFFRVLKYFRPDGGRITGVFCLMLASAGLNALKPWPLALIVDSVLDSKPLPHWMAPTGHFDKVYLLAFLGFAIFMLYFTQAALAAAQNYFSIQASLRGLTRARGELFARLLRLSPRFHQGAMAGDLIYRASWDTYAFQTLFQQGLMTFATALLSLLVMVFIMARLNVPLTFAALALAPMLVVGVRVFARTMRERTAASQQADSRVTALVQQGIAGLLLTQSYTQEPLEAGRFDAAAVDAQTRRLSQHSVELAYGFVVAAIFAFGIAVTTYLGARQVEIGFLTVGELFVFLSYLAQLYEPLNQLSHVGATVAGALGGARRVFEILDTPDQIKEQADAAAVPVASLKLPGRDVLAFRGVCFGYEPGRDVLRDITFTVKSGESMAIIGPSGAGKTTLLHLLPRFFDPARGQIELEGVDLRRLRLAELRAAISLVLQEPIILAATVSENIAYGKPGASPEEIEAAARAANADGFIQKLAQKYQTRIGDGAARLSAGERQRINLARAFLKDAPILLLDEPTSALDSESEELIGQSLDALVRGRTTLIVAHRLETIARMQRVLVLEEGRLTECGGAAELRAAGGYYARVMQA